MRATKVAVTIVLVLILLTLLAAIPHLGVTNLDALHLNCNDCATATPVVLSNRGSNSDAANLIELQIGGTPVFTGGGSSVANFNINNTGGSNIGTFLRLTAQTAISVTNGGVITPTGSYQQLTSGGAVTATLSSGCTSGRIVDFVNTVAQTIIVSETATSALAGNASLGQYDALSTVCDGTRWVELARSNN